MRVLNAFSQYHFHTVEPGPLEYRTVSRSMAVVSLRLKVGLGTECLTGVQLCNVHSYKLGKTQDLCKTTVMVRELVLGILHF